MLSMLHFGKGFDDEVEVSDETNFAVFYDYRDGDWDLYEQAAGEPQPAGFSLQATGFRRSEVSARGLGRPPPREVTASLDWEP